MQRLRENVLHCLHLHFFDDDMTDKSPRQITPVAFKITDTWREKFSNANVTMPNVNIAV